MICLMLRKVVASRSWHALSILSLIKYSPGDTPVSVLKRRENPDRERFTTLASSLKDIVRSRFAFMKSVTVWTLALLIGFVTSDSVSDVREIVTIDRFLCFDLTSASVSCHSG